MLGASLKLKMPVSLHRAKIVVEPKCVTRVFVRQGSGSGIAGYAMSMYKSPSQEEVKDQPWSLLCYLVGIMRMWCPFMVFV